MGYATEFTGEIKINKPLDPSIKELLIGLNKTRRMKRNVAELAKIWSLTLSEAQEVWGAEGEFYVAESFNITDRSQLLHKPTDPTIIDINTPPSTQPSLWCGWSYHNENNSIMWDGYEYFDNYVEWMKYLITKILAPRGYTLNGEIEWYGESRADIGRIVVTNNKVKTQFAKITWCDDKKTNATKNLGDYFKSYIMESSSYDPNALTFDMHIAEYKELIEKYGKDVYKKVLDELGLVTDIASYYDGRISSLRFHHIGDKTMNQLWDEIKQHKI